LKVVGQLGALWTVEPDVLVANGEKGDLISWQVLGFNILKKLLDLVRVESSHIKGECCNRRRMNNLCVDVLKLSADFDRLLIV
jgi:hypothetical protein